MNWSLNGSRHGSGFDRASILLFHGRTCEYTLATPVMPHGSGNIFYFITLIPKETTIEIHGEMYKRLTYGEKEPLAEFRGEMDYTKPESVKEAQGRWREVESAVNETFGKLFNISMGGTNFVMAFSR